MLRITAIVLIISAGQAFADWDLTRQFDLGSNPSGAWQYGFSSSLGSAFTVFANSETRGWNNGDGARIWVNNTTAVRYNVPIGMVALQSGQSSEYAIARWVAPAAGAYSITAQFFQGDNGITDVYVLNNGSTIFSDPSSNNNPLLSPTTLSLSAGTCIDFVVGNIGQSWSNSSTPLTATITAVPEPATLAILGLAGIFLRRKA